MRKSSQRLGHHIAQLAATALIFVTMHSQAVQNLVVVYEDEWSVSYLDFDSIRRQGKTVQYRTIMNYKANGNTGNSAVFVDEIECDKKSYRLIRSSEYSGLYAQGSVINSLTPRSIGANDQFRAIAFEKGAASYNQMTVNEYRLICN